MVVFGAFSCCFASPGKVVSYSLLASTFQQELGLSLCQNAVVYMFFVLFLGVVHLLECFLLYDLVCGFGRRWSSFCPFGTWRLTRRRCIVSVATACGCFSDVGGVNV